MKNLNRFYSIRNCLGDIPDDIIPDIATHIDVYRYLDIKELPKLHSNIRVIFCSDNLITQFNDELPRRLQKLYCPLNKLIAIPTNLPYDMRVLICYGNKISHQICLTKKIVKFDCDNNKTNLKSLPDFTPNLYSFTCFQNNISELPEVFPESMVLFNCSYNNITELPAIIPEKMRVFACSVNKITYLPDIPKSIYKFSCEFNEIKHISEHNYYRFKEIYGCSNRYIRISGNAFYEEHPGVYINGLRGFFNDN
jgi:Leucine-rich repeat (LRR) protein